MVDEVVGVSLTMVVGVESTLAAAFTGVVLCVWDFLDEEDAFVEVVFLDVEAEVGLVDVATEVEVLLVLDETCGEVGAW